jgi:acyl dehydratase
LSAGEQLVPLDVGPVRQDDMRVIAALLRDPNPIHFDTGATRALGLGDRTINQGALNVSYLLRFVTAASDRHTVTRLRVRLAANVYEGDVVRCFGAVTAVDEAAGTAEIDVRAAVGERTVLAGTAYLGVVRPIPIRAV